MPAEAKLAHQRLSVLQLAEILGNVTEACRQRDISRTQFYETVESLQADLDNWLVYYNTERPHQGYRNRGKRPLDTITDYMK